MTKIYTKTNRVAYYSVTMKTPINKWHTVIIKWPEARIVFRPMYLEGKAANSAARKLKKAMISTPSLIERGKSPSETSFILRIKVLEKIVTGAMAEL